MDEAKNITEVCRELNLTSRTIRYYEQRGLIRTVRVSRTAPRKLDSENIARLRRIRFLKSLGLSLDEITDVIDSEEKATALIRSKSADFRHRINEMILHVNMLTEVLTAIEKGETLYTAALRAEHPYDEDEMLRTASDAVHCLLENRFADLRNFLNKDMQETSTDFYLAGWANHIRNCGSFVSFGEQRIVADTVITRLHYEKQDVEILTEVHCGIITGLMLRYSKQDEPTGMTMHLG